MEDRSFVDVADDPTDEDIEAGLQRATEENWRALWQAVEELEQETEHMSWGGGEQVVSTVVDGEARPVTQVPYAIYSEATLRVLRCLAAVGAVTPFDWPAWEGTTRYRGGHGLDAAPVADAVRMTTAIIRAERFSEGGIGATLDDGTFRAAIERIRRWHDEQRLAP